MAVGEEGSKAVNEGSTFIGKVDELKGGVIVVIESANQVRIDLSAKRGSENKTEHWTVLNQDGQDSQLTSRSSERRPRCANIVNYTLSAHRFNRSIVTTYFVLNTKFVQTMLDLDE